MVSRGTATALYFGSLVGMAVGIVGAGTLMARVLDDHLQRFRAEGRVVDVSAASPRESEHSFWYQELSFVIETEDGRRITAHVDHQFFPEYDDYFDLSTLESHLRSTRDPVRVSGYCPERAEPCATVQATSVTVDGSYFKPRFNSVGIMHVD